MLVNEELLKQYGATSISCKKDDVLFREGEKAHYFYQVIEGAVKMITLSVKGQEFIQGVFDNGESFGEPALLGDFEYPASAICLEQSTILRLPKEPFLKMLRENFEVHLKIDKILSNRLRLKNKVLSDISFCEPEYRIANLLEHFRTKFRKPIDPPGKFVVPFTRQQIADMTGMRVETVIRTVKRMEDDGKLKIVGGKILV